MAQDSTPVNKAAKGGDHDRVTMLSLRADGSPDQTPGVEIIGDKEAAIAATAEQFKQQAVSAADREIRGVDSGNGEKVSEKEDPTVEELQKAHEAAAKGADSAAKSVVESLHQGN
jgi:hypothetical protein